MKVSRGLSVAGLVLGVLSLSIAIVSIILSGVGLGKAKTKKVK